MREQSDWLLPFSDYIFIKDPLQVKGFYVLASFLEPGYFHMEIFQKEALYIW